MRVGLFIPCYVDQFYPQVGIATLELLEKLGCDVVYPPNQTCCGQPMANSGFEFLTDVLKVDNLDASFPYKVGLHQSCHGQRGLHLAQMSELMAPPFSKPE